MESQVTDTGTFFASTIKCYKMIPSATTEDGIIKVNIPQIVHLALERKTAQTTWEQNELNLHPCDLNPGVLVWIHACLDNFWKLVW